MTRKDYEVIARSLAFTLAAVEGDARMGVIEATKDLAEALKLTNPRFSPERFVKAVLPTEVTDLLGGGCPYEEEHAAHMAMGRTCPWCGASDGD